VQLFDTMSVKRVYESSSGDYLSFTPLGAGCEVGRSCHIIKFKGKTIMLDAGMHPGYTGISSLPYFDEINPSEIDLILISHFHLDHAAALPYFLEKTDFKGACYMTHPTKSIYKLILQDYVKVSSISVEESLYDEKDLLNSMEKIKVLNYHQTVYYNGIKFTAYNAGHVLGAAMFMIEIAGVNILYTGDYSRREDRHLMAAETPPIKPDILIIEATYGIQTLPPVNEREKRFTDLVSEIVYNRGGKCLLPVFALGRAQELLLILDEYWHAHNPIVTVYYISILSN
jgi:cleavage and polyadenylation specificity factor subunit 3